MDLGNRNEACFEELVYGTFDRSRYTQDSPVLFDVYNSFGTGPNTSRDLLLTPDWSRQPAELADRLQRSFGIAPELDDEGNLLPETDRDRLATMNRLQVAYNQSVVAIKLDFRELVRHVLPLSWWWQEWLVPLRNTNPTKVFTDHATATVAREQLEAGLAYLIEQRDRPQPAAGGAFDDEDVEHTEARTASSWLIRGEMIWAAHLFYLIEGSNQPSPDSDGGVVDLPADRAEDIADWFIELVSDIPQDAGYTGPDAWVFSVNINRRINQSTELSVPTTKADVVRRAFQVTGAGIRWAVIDSGIDARHVAFRRKDPVTGVPEREPFAGGNRTRIKATYDFSRIRKQLSDFQRGGLHSGRLLDWREVEAGLANTEHPLQVPHTAEGYQPPTGAHGTHVAGIIAADWDPALDDVDPIAPPTPNVRPASRVLGMCPGIELYDLRVFRGRAGDEFSVISALQFVRHLNLQYDTMEVHGVNLSLAVRHDVRNFACGRSPVCEESTRLVNNSVVVVAAAGNSGRAVYTSEQGVQEEGFRSVSIADPGNAEAVITVGATHRERPHEYGVSYFSSRGPTGDGRMKPDLVAPGEKVLSTVPGDQLARKDGTSQAAPHVSGAAALLMSRHSELIGDPARVKSILMRSATDLGRERAYQGAGLVDVFRAMQDY